MKRLTCVFSVIFTAGRKGAGALFPDVPFKLAAPNITPDPETGVAKWTDAGAGTRHPGGQTRPGGLELTAGHPQLRVELPRLHS